MNLNNVALIKKYGSWVRVQVAFYDFIFLTGSEMCAKHWKQMMLTEIARQFKDGGDLYEKSVQGIERAFTTPETAWSAFLESEFGDGFKDDN